LLITRWGSDAWREIVDAEGSRGIAAEARLRRERRTIAQSVGVGRTTVAKYLRRSAEIGDAELDMADAD